MAYTVFGCKKVSHSPFGNFYINAQNCLYKEIYFSKYLKLFSFQFFTNKSGYCSITKKYIIKVRKKDIANSSNNKINIKKVNNFTNKFIYGPKLNSSHILNLHSNHDNTQNEVLTAENSAQNMQKYYDENAQASFERVLNDVDEKEQQSSVDTIKIDNSRYNNVPLEMNINYILSSLPFNFQTSYKLNDGHLRPISERGNIGLPSVTTILNATMPAERKEILRKWEEKKKKELGEVGFAIYRQDLFDRGTILHSCIETYLNNNIDPTDEHLEKLEETWTSVKHVLNGLTEVQMTEKMVVHPHLHYHGFLDCVAKFKDTLVVIEFKTSTKTKLTLKSTFDAPLQLVAYLGALSFDPNFNLSQIKKALLVIAYPTGLPANAHLLSEVECVNYYKLWCQRLVKFWQLRAVS